MKLSICVPVYKSETILEKFVETIKKEVTFVDSYELILVNDCSPDKSWEKIVQLKNKYTFIIGVNLIKNFSQHNAVMAGLNEASGDIVITMDDDLQHNPADIIKLYNKIINEKYDVCYTKFLNREHKNWKVLGSKFNDMVANLLISKPKDLYLSPFRAMTKQVKDLIVSYDGPYPYVDGLILSATNNLGVIEVEHNKRFEGEGNYNFVKSVSLWTKMATGFSILPLRIATYLGIFTALSAFLLLIVFVLQKFIYNSMPDGWTSIVVLILFFGGIQLFSIGIIGEYVGRTYLNINKKKQFIVREKV
jgi:undecaprenyl-phosphate 4-deoxy-4-formamido-L-arabinose transferase